MSVTFRLVRSGLSFPQFSNRLNRLSAIPSSGHLIGLIDTSIRVPQRNLHQPSPSQPLCIGSNIQSYSMIPRSHTSAVNNRVFRLYSSETAKSDSLGQLVYEGRVSKMLKLLKVFSLTTSGVGLSIQPYLWITYQNMPIVAAIPIFAFLNCFVFVNPILIHYVSKKYITELYFNHDTKVFTAYVLTFFATRETITFTSADINVPDVPNMFAMFNIKGRPFFVHEKDFTGTEVYQHLMGFDRPLDLTFILDDVKNEAHLHDEIKSPTLLHEEKKNSP